MKARLTKLQALRLLMSHGPCTALQLARHTDAEAIGEGPTHRAARSRLETLAADGWATRTRGQIPENDPMPNRRPPWVYAATVVDLGEHLKAVRAARAGR